MTRTPAAVSSICLLLVAACSAPPAPEAEWMPLFDGKTLQDWTQSENPESFRVEDGAIACDGPRAPLTGARGDSRFSAYIIAVGGAGSSGLPARESGRRMR